MSSPGLGFSSWRRKRSSSLTEQAIASEDESQAAHIISPPRSVRHAGGADARQLSSSFSSQGHSHREPIRSYIHGSTRENLAPVDGSQYARSVREDTAELADYALADKKGRASPSFLARTRSVSSRIGRASTSSETGADDIDGNAETHDDTIVEVSEPSSPEDALLVPQPEHAEGLSVLGSMLRSSPLQEMETWATGPPEPEPTPLELPPPRPLSIEAEVGSDEEAAEIASEGTPLIGGSTKQQRQTNGHQKTWMDLEGQKIIAQKWRHGIAEAAKSSGAWALGAIRTVSDPKQWDRRAIWKNVVVAPVSSLPAVVVGLLLNILDALSYGKYDAGLYKATDADVRSQA
jgi:sulfate permease, SulP family